MTDDSMNEVKRLREEKNAYDDAIRNLDALVDCVRYRIDNEQCAQDVADEINIIIAELEEKVGDIV